MTKSKNETNNSKSNLVGQRLSADAMITTIEAMVNTGGRVG